MSRLRALIGKEFARIRRDKRLASSLIIPPTLQLLLFGFALDSTVFNWGAGNPARSRLSAGSGRLERRLRPRLAALQKVTV